MGGDYKYDQGERGEWEGHMGGGGGRWEEGVGGHMGGGGEGGRREWEDIWEG